MPGVGIRGDAAGAGAAALSDAAPGPSGERAPPPNPAVTGRVAFLDVLRGIAILGILPINAWSFAYPSDVYDTPSHPEGGGSAAAVALVKWLFESKFITLFALLFGVGMGVQWLRAQASGRAYGPPMARRLAVLVVFGALHATLLWYGDIVFIYGLLGLVLCWFAAARRDVLAWIGALALLPTLGFHLLQLLAALVAPDASVEWVRASQEPAIYGSGTFGEIAGLRAEMWAYLVLGGLFFHGPRLAGLFLLGMAAAKSPAWLSPGSPEGARLHRRIALVGLPCGLVLDAAYAQAAVASDVWAVQEAGEILHYAGSLLLAGGYASTVALLVARAPDALWSRPFAAIGRTAFSCYIGQSLVMTTIFYSYGLALFDQVSRWELWGIVVAVWCAQLVLAPLWLAFFRIGPLEWLWRSLTHLRPQPLLRGRA